MDGIELDSLFTLCTKTFTFTTKQSKYVRFTGRIYRIDSLLRIDLQLQHRFNSIKLGFGS